MGRAREEGFDEFYGHQSEISAALRARVRVLERGPTHASTPEVERRWRRFSFFQGNRPSTYEYSGVSTLSFSSTFKSKNR